MTHFPGGLLFASHNWCCGGGLVNVHGIGCHVELKYIPGSNFICPIVYKVLSLILVYQYLGREGIWCSEVFCTPNAFL